MMTMRFGVAVFGASIFAAVAAFAEPRYRAVDLPALDSAQAMAIDDKGIVAVVQFDPDGFSAILVDGNTGQVVARMPGEVIQALSGNGNMVGFGPAGQFAIIDGVRTAVPLARALAVNDRGQVVGFAGGFFPRAALFDARDGMLTDLGTLGGQQSVAFAINDRGQVTGGSNPAGTQAIHAFRWTRGSMEDLGTLGGQNSFANGIDHHGRVVGTAETATSTHAFVFDDDGMHDLGTLPGCDRSVAQAINSHGVVVGGARDCGPADARAFVVLDGAMLDLNDLLPPRADGFVYAGGTAVDDAGMIAGTAISPDGSRFRPFVLVPEDR